MSLDRQADRGGTMKEPKPPFEWRRAGDSCRLGLQDETEPLCFNSRDDAYFLAHKAGLKFKEDYDYRAVTFHGMVCWNVEAKETDG
ncbi:hypothetical protein ES703_28429 [subsurface metagenome]